MLSTGTIVWLSFFGAISAGLIAVLAYAMAYQAREIVRTQNRRSVALRQIAELSGEVTQLQDAYNSLLESHKKLRSRIGMRDVRRRRANGADELPDPMHDPAGYKRAMRLKLRSEGKLR